MNEEELVNFFSDGIKKIDSVFGDKVKSIPIYGPVIHIFLDTFIDSMDSFVLDSFKKVYDERIGFLLEPITNATKYRVNVFFNKFSDQLGEEYATELENKNFIPLKKAYNVLYRILVLKDIVLLYVYSELIKTKQWKEIVEDFYNENGILKKFTSDASSFVGSFEHKKIVFAYEEFLRNFTSKTKDELKDNPDFKNMLKEVASKIFGEKKDDI